MDAEQTSPYDFYQFWIRADDRDVINYLKYFTMLSRDEIEGLAAQTANQPERRETQRALANELTRLVHGQEALDQVAQASENLFGGALSGLSDEQLLAAFEAAPRTKMARSELEGGVEFIDALIKAGLAKSRGAARRLISQGGAYINNQGEKSIDRQLGVADLASEHFLVLRLGKKNYHLLHFE